MQYYNGFHNENPILSTEELIIERRGVVALLTLNRPRQLNALTFGLRRAMVSALRSIAEDDSLHCLLLTGAGERAFCAGQDLAESAALDGAASHAWMQSWKDYFQALGQFPKPMVAAINGVAAGAGFQTALLADLRLAVDDARLLMAEVDVGLPAIVGGYLLEQHLGQSRARELVLSGRSVAAAEAHRIGLVHELAPRPDLPDKALATARLLAEKPPVAMRLTVGNFRRAMAEGLAEAEQAALHYQTRAMATGEPQRVMAAFFAARRAGRADNRDSSGA
jgi:enoyl-CoA hydratase/carnithine racemase